MDEIPEITEIDELQQQKEIWEAEDKTVVLIAVDDKLEGIMGIADAIKPDSISDRQLGR